MTRHRVTLGLTAFVLIDFAIVVMFRHTDNWRLGRFIVWWSPALLLLLGLAAISFVRPWKWKAVTLIVGIVVALSVNVAVAGGSLVPNECPRIAVTPEVC